MSQRRGFMLAPYAPLKDVEDALRWNANIFRYQFTTDVSNPLIHSVDGYLQWVNTHIGYLDNVLVPACRGKANVVVDLHTPPYGQKPPSMAALTAFDVAWRRLAEQYNNHDVVALFDVANEPGRTAADVNSLNQRLVAEIRKYNQRTRVGVMPRGGDATRANEIPSNTVGGLTWVTPHVYFPGEFTHQGIGSRPVGVRYPLPNKGKDWIQRQCSNLRKLQTKARATILIGEFSASTYGADRDRAQYISDCIDIFEQYGWHWCYHAWRESPVWNCEKTGVEKVLKRWFARNS